MPTPGLLLDLVAPGWSSLTGDQQTCWFYWAAEHPKMSNDGRFGTLYGMQAYYSQNASLYVLDTPAPISDPPANLTKPTPIKVRAASWRKQARGPTFTTWRDGVAVAWIEGIVSNNSAGIIVQNYTRQRNRPGRPTGNRHVQTIAPSATGQVPLRIPNGYYSTAVNGRRWGVIKGKTAIRRPDLPLARLKTINLENGEEVETTIANPNGGAPKKIRRPKHYP